MPNDDPPKPYSLFIQMIAAMSSLILGAIVIGILTEPKQAMLAILGFSLCIGLPIGLIYGLYKIYERTQRNKPPKESVQTLKLDE